MNLDNLNNIDEHIRKPGYLLFLVIVLLFLIIGFVNMLDHNSGDAQILGRYSLLYFGFLVTYLLGILVWVILLFKPNDDRWLKTSLDFVQKRPILGMGILATWPVILWHMFTRERWLNFPAMQVTIIVFMLLAGGLILFYRWDDKTRPLLWRKAIVYPLAFLLVIEIVFQSLTLFGGLPNLTLVTDSFAPFGRVYHTNEGFGNGMANSKGWYYPPFRLLPESHRVMILGDSFIQALQIEPEQNLGVLLEQLINQDLPEGEIVEILALGNPDYGPGLYLNPPMIDFAIDEFEPDEVISFFDLGNDFQTADSPNTDQLYFLIGENGEVEIHPDSFGQRHDYQHAVLHGYEGFQLNRFLQSHYLTLRYVRQMATASIVSAETTSVPAKGDLDLPNAFVFNETLNDEAMAIATGHLQIAHAHLQEKGVDFRLVTIPVFTDVVYEGTAWNTQFGQSDLLLPERELRTFAAANDIPFLGLGAYMVSELTPTEAQTLYFNEGRGHFTPAGHETVAKAVYQCFFAQTAAPGSGCDAR
jgi:hypothetical protein